MDNTRIASIIQAQVDESINLEFKAGFKWMGRPGWLQAKVIRAILGFTNTKNGGIVLIGISDDGAGNREYGGLDAEQLMSFRNTESILDRVGRYADGPVSFSVSVIEVEDDGATKSFVAFDVNEFELAPVLAKRDLKATRAVGHAEEFVIHENDMYSRAKSGRPATIKATRLELREIISMAHSKDEQRIVGLFNQISPRPIATLEAETSPYEQLDGDL